MRSVFVVAVSGLLLAASAASAQAPANLPARPAYNQQKPSENIGPFAGGAKTHRLTPARAAAAGKARRAHH